MEQDITYGLGIGADDYLAKPEHDIFEGEPL